MQAIVTLFKSVPLDGVRNDDDFADRLNHRFTVAILIAFSFLVATKTLVGK